MSEIRTEEEQIQALKGWWAENGKSLVLGVGLAVAAVVGWKGWQDHQAVQAENASVLYQNMVEAAVSTLGAVKDEAQLATTHHLAGQLKSDYESSVYARYAALIEARIAVESKDYDRALAELDWVLAHKPSEEMQLVATVRKARVMAAKGEVEAGLALLSGLQAGSFQSTLDEVRGDLYMLKGDVAAARSAYESAAAANATGGARPLLTMKLDDLVEG